MADQTKYALLLTQAEAAILQSLLGQVAPLTALVDNALDAGETDLIGLVNSKLPEFLKPLSGFIDSALTAELDKVKAQLEGVVTTLGKKADVAPSAPPQSATAAAPTAK